MTTGNYIRPDQRKHDELRPMSISPDVAPSADGSVLISMGGTQVICGVTIENKVPGWMRYQKIEGGWITAEYRMLPYATQSRNQREHNGVSGRTHEIQRLIGRSLRAAVDLKKLGSKTIWIDCDVLAADGGTRTASVTGAFAALRLAVNRLLEKGTLKTNPLIEQVAAVSVGIVEQTALLDLCYIEDLNAETDMNVVMTKSGEFIEIQGTAEERPYTREQLDRMLDIAGKGMHELFALQDQM
jgi:ribonuclease PH